MQFKNFAKYTFISLLFLTLLTPLLLFRDLLFPYITGKAFFLRIVVELILPFYLYLVFSDKSLRPNFRNPLTLAVLAFLAISFISASFGADFSRSFWSLFDRMDGVFMLIHYSLFYFYLLLFAELSGRAFEYFLKALVWVSVITAVNGIVGFLGGPTLTPDSSLPARASSTLGNPIFFASFLIFPIVLAVFFALRSEAKRGKILYWLLFAIQLLALIFSGTRGAVVGIFAGVFLAAVFFIVLQKNRKARIVGTISLAGLVIMAVLLLSFRQSFPQGSSVRRLLSFGGGNTQARIIQWKTAIRGFKDAPILGVGPNNYSIISNKYYTPEIWQYDSNWFDKPHNYQLEVLATTGILGFMAYAMLILIALWMVYRGYKSGLLSLAEASLFVAGFSAYQIQNLFVFDTISASQAFFVFLAFAVFLHSNTAGDLKTVKNPTGSLGSAKAAVYLGLPIALYCAYALNWTGGRISKDLNLARLFQQENFDVAKGFLDDAVNSPFNFYLRDTAYEYSNFAAWYSNRNQEARQLEKSRAMMLEAVDINRRAVAAHPKDPTVWLKLSNVLFAQSHLENSGFNQQAYDAAYKSYELVPKRSDPKLLMAQIAIGGKKNDLAEKWLNEVLTDYPSLEDARWQLANLYYFSGRQKEAKDLAEQALAKNYRVDKITKGDWLITYYYENQLPEKALEFLLSQSAGNEKVSDYFARLADAYNKSGRYAEARFAAMKVLELDPTSKTDVEAFLNGLPD